MISNVTRSLFASTTTSRRRWGWGLLFLLQLLGRTAAAQFADEAPIDPNSENPRLHGLGTVIDTNYPMPAGAYFVADSTGNDATGTGTQANPWKTIGKAATMAPAGATIVVRGGTYRIGTQVNLNRKVIIQPFAHERVWVKGSTVVADWTQEPGQQVWRKDNWTYAFARLSVGSPSVGACTRCIDARYPEADYRDMAFFDGKSMKQVLSLAAVVAGTFYVDNAAQKVYIGNNPAGKTVELTTAERAFSVSGDEVVVRGLGLAHYADRAIHINNGADYGVFEKNTFVWNALEGLGCTGVHVTFRDNHFAYNGQLGMEAGRSHNSLLEGNTFRFNNVEFFRTGWAAAGVKVTEAANMTFRNNYFEKNYAHTLWLDNGIRDAVVVGNVFRSNSGQAILFEISNGAIIAGNVCVGNSVGIAVSGSQNAQVYNNTLVNNGIPLVVNEYIRNDIAHLFNFRVENAVFKNNLLSNGTTVTGGALFSVARSDCARKDPMVTGLDYNAYYRTSASQPATAVRWNPVVGTCTGTAYPTVEAFHTAYPAFEEHAVTVNDNTVNPFFIDQANGDYRLKPGSPAINAGTPLPAAVAQVLGWEEGVPVNIGAKPTYDGTTGDVTAPTAPLGLLSPAKSATTITLGWTPSTDNVGVTRYYVYKAGVLLGSTTAAQPTFTATGLLPNQPYSFTVTARDASGNVSAASAPLVVTTDNDTEAPAAPANLALTSVAASSAALVWSAATDNVEVTHYEVYSGATLLGTVGRDTTFRAFRLTPGTAYSLTVKARDAAGNRSAASAPLLFTTPAGSALTVRDDAYVRDGAVAAGTQAEANKNFGTFTTLLIKHATDGTRREGYFKFDLPTGGRPVAAAKMLLYGSLATGGSPTVPAALYTVADNAWNERTLTWNNKPASSGAALATVTLANTAAKFYEWDLTAHVRAQQQAGSPSFSVALKHTVVTSNTANWTAKEGGSNAPYLEITYYDLTTQALANVAYCPGSRLAVPFTATGTYDEGNIFTAQLSDANGSFANPTVLGTLAASAPGQQTIQTALPATAGAGSGYRLRVVSSSPAVVGSDNGTNVTIHAPATAHLDDVQAICPGDSTQLTVTLTGTAPWTLTYNDGASMVIVGGITASPYPLVVRPTADSTRYTLAYVTDGNCSGTVSGSALVTLNRKPVLTAPSSIVMVADSGACGANVSFAASATGSPAPAVSYAVGTTAITSPYWFPIGTSVVTVRAANACGTDTTSFTVTVTDTQRPVLLAPASVQVATAAGLCGVARENVPLEAPQVSDNCAEGLTVANNAPASFPVGTTIVTWTATDASGNTTTATQPVTVTDSEAPVVRTQPLTVQLDAQGQATISPAQVDNGSSDNCGVEARTLSTSHFDCRHVGPNRVTLTITDVHGNVATDTAVVTVEDRPAPTVHVQNLRVSLVNGTATITAAQVDNGSTDNCGIQTLSVDKTRFTCANLGANLVTLTVTDTHGNTATATATVTVTGSLPTPAITVTPASNVYTGGIPTNLYLGYGPQSVILTATGGTSYQWSPATGLSNAASATPVFTATTPGTFAYTVTATSTSGCTATATVSLTVTDVRCGNRNDKVLLCYRGNQLCVPSVAVRTLLSNPSGSQGPNPSANNQTALGSCPTAARSTGTGAGAAPAGAEPTTLAPLLDVFPNPSAGSTTLRFRATQAGPARVQISNNVGQVVAEYVEEAAAGQVYERHLPAAGLPAGVYTVRFIGADGHPLTQRLVLTR